AGAADGDAEGEFAGTGTGTNTGGGVVVVVVDGTVVVVDDGTSVKVQAVVGRSEHRISTAVPAAVETMDKPTASATMATRIVSLSSLWLWLVDHRWLSSF
ncbi:MAG TPA: hypothetical protein VD926_15775, partial [Acidimicrobiales bacterium]|nr:hypothetical protein [Acidimicrobiales bacterium]